MIVYRLYNPAEDKSYIGATVRQLKDRLNDHRKCAKKGKSGKLYDAIRKYGFDTFEVEVLVECNNHKDLYDEEERLISKYNSIDDGYNKLTAAPQREDWEEFFNSLKPSEQMKKQISNSLQEYRAENPFTDEHRKRISNSMKGNKNGSGNNSHGIGCYCIIDGDRIDFKNYKDAGIWWYENYKPFGEKYSSSTYQRKIIDCIDKKMCHFKNKDGSYIIITENDIQWFRK